MSCLGVAMAGCSDQEIPSPAAASPTSPEIQASLRALEARDWPLACKLAGDPSHDCPASLKASLSGIGSDLVAVPLADQRADGSGPSVFRVQGADSLRLVVFQGDPVVHLEVAEIR